MSHTKQKVDLTYLSLILQLRQRLRELRLRHFLTTSITVSLFSSEMCRRSRTFKLRSCKRQHTQTFKSFNHVKWLYKYPDIKLTGNLITKLPFKNIKTSSNFFFFYTCRYTGTQFPFFSQMDLLVVSSAENEAAKKEIFGEGMCGIQPCWITWMSLNHDMMI